MGLPEELKTHAAAKWLGIKGAMGGMQRALEILPRRKIYTGNVGHPSWAYRTEHIRRMRKIMDQANVGVAVAARVVVAEIEGRI